MKTFVVGTHLKRLDVALPMNTHNTRFYGEINLFQNYIQMLLLNKSSGSNNIV